MSDGFDVDEAIDGYQLRVEEARICLRQDLLAEHRRLEMELAAAMQSDSEAALALAERVAEVEQEIRDAERVFRFEAVSKREWQDMLRDHPPTDEQLAAVKGLDYNPETFPFAAIAASSLEPKLTAEQAKRMEERFKPTDFDMIWGTVLRANIEVSAAPKSVLAGAVLLRNAGSSTTAPRKASRGRSSSAANGARTRPASTTKNPAA